MKFKQTLTTLVTLANGCELATAITSAVVGNDVADTVDGNTLTSDAISHLVMSNFQTKLNTYRRSI